MYDNFLIKGFLEESDEGVEWLLVGGLVNEGLNDEIIDNFAGLFAVAAVDSEYFEEEMLVVVEGLFEPVDAV